MAGGMGSERATHFALLELLTVCLEVLGEANKSQDVKTRTLPRQTMGSVVPETTLSRFCSSVIMHGKKNSPPSLESVTDGWIFLKV